ncbi:unnamed protein product [Colias eurytheme]|nr:unnamed protein product [Colias eurytheme]
MLNIYYQNTRGLRTKTHTFSRQVLCNQFDIIVLTETWLNSSVNNSELFDPRYIVYRRDRGDSKCCKRDGGGVLIAVSRKLNSKQIFCGQSSLENLWVLIETHKTDSNPPQQLALCVTYLPPPHDNDPKHIANSVREFLREPLVSLLLERPANSPDQNPIENLWHIV